MIRRNPVTVIHWDIDVIIEYRIHDTQTTELNNHSFVSSLSWQHKLLVDFVPTSPPSYFFFISLHSITTVISFVWFRIQVTHHQGYIDCTLYFELWFNSVWERGTSLLFIWETCGWKLKKTAELRIRNVRNNAVLLKLVLIPIQNPTSNCSHHYVKWIFTYLDLHFT